MADPAIEALKENILQAARGVRRSEARLFRAMAEFFDKADSPQLTRAEAIAFLTHATGKSQRTVYHYLAVGYGLIKGQLTEKQVEVHGFTKIIASKDSWLKGDSSWAKRNKALTVTACLRGKGVKTSQFMLNDEQRDRLSEALLMAGAIRRGKGLLNKEEALLNLADSYIALSEAHAGLKEAS